MDSICQVESLRHSLSDDTVGVYEPQVEPEHEDLDWDSFTTSPPLHQVNLELCFDVLLQFSWLSLALTMQRWIDVFPWEHDFRFIGF